MLGCGCCDGGGGGGGDDDPTHDPLCGCFANENAPVLFADKTDDMDAPDASAWRFIVPPGGFPPGWSGEYYVDDSRRFTHTSIPYNRNTPSPYIPNDGALRYATNRDIGKPHPQVLQYFSLDFTEWDFSFKHTFDLDLSVCPDWFFNVQFGTPTDCFEWYRDGWLFPGGPPTGGRHFQGFELTIRDTAPRSTFWGPCGPWKGILDFGIFGQHPNQVRTEIGSGTHTIEYVWRLAAQPIYPATYPIIQDIIVDGVTLQSLETSYTPSWVTSGCAGKPTPWLRFCFVCEEFGDLTYPVFPNGLYLMGDNWVGPPRDLIKFDEWTMLANQR
jgi:hypothetical protein